MPRKKTARTEPEEELLLSGIPEWRIDRSTIHRIARTFSFRSFTDAVDFVNSVAAVAEFENHHPDIHIRFRNVTIECYSHAAHGLTENDFIVAARVDAESR